MMLTYKVYDTDLHMYLDDDEVRVAPSGQLYYKDCAEPLCNAHWTKLMDGAEWMVIEQIIIGEQLHETS